ncbi:MAG: hypothetical protein RL154_1336 [Pseudomonadota bacterium]|jgi:uncharacterized membrane protein (DUF485 family)
MKSNLVDTIKNDPAYKELMQKRTSFSVMLAIIMLVVYYAFILLIAFNKKILGVPVADGMVMSVGIPMGLGIIILAFVLTGIYTKRANTEFDALSDKIKENVKKAGF